MGGWENIFMQKDLFLKVRERNRLPTASLLSKFSITIFIGNKVYVLQNLKITKCISHQIYT
jgi:hypothetical protein